MLGRLLQWRVMIDCEVLLSNSRQPLEDRPLIAIAHGVSSILDDVKQFRFVQPEVAYFHTTPPRLTLLKVMAQGEPDEKLWRERNVCCF
jgi:hypothetical protein